LFILFSLVYLVYLFIFGWCQPQNKEQLCGWPDYLRMGKVVTRRILRSNNDDPKIELGESEILQDQGLEGF